MTEISPSGGGVRCLSSRRHATPCLKEERGNNERSGVCQVESQSGRQFVKLTLTDQALVEDSMPYVLNELEQQHATRVRRGVYVNHRVHANVGESGVSQHARHPETDGPVDPVQLTVGIQKL